MNKSFVDIVSLFKKQDERSIEALSNVYADMGRLTEILELLVGRHFSEECVRNKKVLLKPNWVKHSDKQHDAVCLRTNDSFLLATLEVFLKLRPASIIIGDAPIQGCKWDLVVTEALKEKIDTLALAYNTPVKIKDFRRVVFMPNENKPLKARKPLADYLIFDLGKHSYLEPITDPIKNVFRVADYNPDRLAESHRPGVHKYCVVKELFEADVVISLPKAKTHQKAGITCALKNLVGFNGDKDYLPHHRIGGTNRGGDCYPGKSKLQYWAELTLDFANRHQGSVLYTLSRKLTSLFWRLSLPKNGQFMSAGWFGNDTTWRMVLDLNKIAVYGKSDGTISETPQRELYSLCDGIIGGQGDGPLRPDPLALGIVSLTNNSGANDLLIAALMNFKWRDINMLNEVSNHIDLDKVSITWNNHLISLDALRENAICTAPPPGWVDRLNKK